MGATAVAQLSQFVAAILFFHGSEYALAVFFHGRSNVSLGSLLISKLYVIAMVSALVEYLIEVVHFPGLKEHWWLSNIGLMMVLLGELIRKAAIITARRSFTHNIRVYYDEEHELITHGIYRLLWLFHLGNWNPGYALQPRLHYCIYCSHLAILL